MNNFHKYHFTGQKDNEKILLVVRRHWFNMFVQFLPIILLALLLLFSYRYLPEYFPILVSSTFYNFFLFILSLGVIFTWVLFFVIFTDYYLDVWIITEERVVNIEQKGFFSRIISELELEKIQDITTEVTGLVQTILNYGDVFIQTAAEKERFRFRQVSDPYKIKDALMALQKRQEKEEIEELRDVLKGK